MSLHITHPDTPEAALQRVVHFFEHLQPSGVAQIAQLYTADAHFKDPFNEVQGIAAIEHIFTHMFEALDAPRFVITQQVRNEAQCFVTWDFFFSVPRMDKGATHFVLREESGVWRVAVHRDYWDAAEELYEKLPVVGGLMRWLKKRANS